MVYEIGEYGHYGGFGARINPEKFLERKIKRVREFMKKYNFGSILCLTEPNIAYVTNTTAIIGALAGIGGYRYAILPIEGEPILFERCDPAFHIQKQIPYITVKRSVPYSGGVYNSCPLEAQKYLLRAFTEQIKDSLKELKLNNEIIGIDADVPHVVKALESQGLNVNIDGRKIMQEARMVKLPEEQQMFRRLANVLDGCFGVIARTARPGVPEYEVLGAAAKYALSHYVSPDGGYILSGQHTWPKDQSRQCTDRKLRVGDTVVIDLYNYKYFGYCSCYYRTFSIGTAAKDVKETYNEVVTMLIEAEKILKPGITTKDVVEKWKDEIELWSNKPPFIRDERDSLSTFMNNMGHGLGLMTVYDPPFFWRPISLKYPQKLEAGMVIALETQGGTPDNRCGVRVEDMIIITDGGYEVISRWPKEEITELPLY